jgi:hypothetical protein
MSRPSTSSTSHTQQIIPTVPSQIHTLAAPTPSLVDAQLPSYLLPCVLDLLRDSSKHVIQKKRKLEDELREEGLLPKEKGKAKEDMVEQEMARKVERMGLMAGGYIAEKWVKYSLTLLIPG